ncbi:MAG TPA: APC family permease [Bryobacteraceae bacterium]|nr:APC family permease [Bryobacteraceae bacterium]
MKLRRELGLRDITLFAIACTVGTRWIASAAHAGSGSILLWLVAAILFLIPLSVATAALTEKHPEAGGLYVWTRGDFGPWHGFLAFWVYWMGIMIWFPSAAMFYMSIAISSLGPGWARLAEGRAFLLAASLGAIWIALGTNLIGVKIGKWTENLGALASWILGALLVIMAALVWRRRGVATPFQLLPGFSWGTVSFLATIAYALSGFEMVGLMGGEIRHPQRDLPRAARIASAFATLFYVATTMALLVILRPENISELNGLAQVATETGRVLGIGWLPPAIALLVMATAIGQFGGLGSSVSRMPFAAGVDHLLPAAFAKIHPRWATPYVSILTLGGLASVLLVAIQFGDTIRGAYQTLVSLMVIAGFLPYLYMFGSAWKSGRKVSAISGWSITLLAVLCAVVPTEEIHNVWLFEFKLAAGTFAVIASAWLVYRRTRLSRARI